MVVPILFMKNTSLIAQLLGIEEMVVVSFTEQSDALLVKVRPAWKGARCSRCRESIGRRPVGRSAPRHWRHLDIVGTTVILQYRLRRVKCPNCGVVLEAVPWSDDLTSDYTKQFEEEAARVSDSLHGHSALLGTISSTLSS